MTFRIDGGKPLCLSGLDRRPRSGAAAQTRSGRQSFDQVSFSAQLSGDQMRARGLADQLVQQVRSRPSSAELDALRQQIQEGSYSIDAGRIAARLLLFEQEGQG